MEVTKGLVLAVERGIEALRSRADEAEKEPESQADTSVGRIVRLAIEEERQAADMLQGWADRARSEAGMPPRNADA